ncbi:MAG: hypothetical protein H0U03_14240 [Actinobacteria bacterium]|nr:hypothetical protein [Actinomycetota bacterium]
MIDTEPRLRERLKELAGPLDESGADWDAVRRRLDATPRTTSWRLVLATAAAAVAAVVIAVTPVGGGLVRSVGDFSAWLRGQPGQPASEAEQRELAEESARAWTGFPDTVALRRLLAQERDGIEYQLFGFRTGDSLCLRLVARGSGEEPATSCAPLRDLQRAEAPALVLLVDHPFGVRQLPVGARPGEYAPVRASATFGIVADGVTDVELVADDGRRRALVAANSFLHIASDPAVGARVREAFATDTEGRSQRVPLASAPFGLTDGSAVSRGEAQGPTRVERHVEGGQIGWLVRREPRGEPLGDAATLTRVHRVVFGRVIQPDPKSFVRMFLALVHSEERNGPLAGQGPALCYGALRPGVRGYGCAPLDRFFDRGGVGPLLVTVGSRGGDQYSSVEGVASDFVDRIELFLATGERVAVPLEDNVFFVPVARTKFPVRVVAYDQAGRVISIRTFGDESGPRAVPGKERIALEVEGRNATAVLRVAPSTDGGRCWRISYSTGSEGGGCPPKSYRGPVLDAVLQPAGRDVFVEVEVRDEVDLVVIERPGEDDVRVRPVEGFAIHPLTTDDKEVFVTVRALAGGRELAKRGVRIER